MRRGQVDVFTLGCSKNLVDSERLLQLFALVGYHVSHNPERATGEIVVVNTCGFIEAAKEESIGVILSLGEAKRRGEVGKLFVMGCLSERYGSELQKLLPEVDKMYGKFDWQQMISDLGHAHHSSPANERFLTTPPHYSYLKIAEGCSRRCAYCAIPLITGPQVSRPIEDLVWEAHQLANSGTTELLLIAQDLTAYGRDLGMKNGLCELLPRLSDIEGLRWIRLHYAYPNQFPLGILPIMRERDNIVPYLDIALQHASDAQLRKMRRGITAAATEELLHTIRAEVPGIVLRTTMMVGHPGETEEDFAILLDFVKRMRFERMGAFAYSHEEGTYSYLHYSDDVPAKEKLHRLDRLMDLQQELGSEFASSLVGSRQMVVIDSIEGATAIGRTRYDSPEVDCEVYISGEKTESLKVGQYYEVTIIDSEGLDLCAEAKTAIPL